MKNFYLDSMRPDDTFFLLDGTRTSLSQCLDTLELLGECSGLKVNVEKTKAVWLGSKRFSKRPTLAFKVAVFLGDLKRFKATLGKFPQNVMRFMATLGDLRRF